MKRVVRIVVLISVLGSLFVFGSSQLTNGTNISQIQNIGTGVFIPNNPPTFSNQINNYTWVKNHDLINAFDLDDYFFDEGGFLNFTFESTPNITIVLDDQNRVSFYPDENFTGTRFLRINASDGLYITPSNQFSLTVGNDEDPPKWKAPQKSLPIIYQNFVINFSTIWTDNFQLKKYQFSINQGGGWTSYDEVNFSGTQNTSKATVEISAGPGTVVFWTFTAYDLAENMNLTSIQNFTVATPPDPGEPDPDEISNGTGTGTGSTSKAKATPPTYVPAQPPSTKLKRLANFTVEKDAYFLKIMRGKSETIFIKITNIGNVNISFGIAMDQIDSWSTIAAKNITLIPGEAKSIAIDIKPSSTTTPDLYFGSIEINSSAGNVKIPVSVEVYAPNLALEVKVKVPSSVKQSERVFGNITVMQTGDIQARQGILYYAIKDFEGNILDSKQEENSTNLKEVTYERFLTPPDNVPAGQYIFFARFVSGDQIGIDAQLFEIGEYFSFASFIKFNLIFIILFIGTFIISMMVLRYNHYREHVKLLNLYILAKEMKELMDKNKPDEALKLFIRIKSYYGEPITQGALQDKEKMIAEMKRVYDGLSEAAQEIRKEDVKNGDNKSETKNTENKEGKIEENKAPSPIPTQESSKSEVKKDG